MPVSSLLRLLFFFVFFIIFVDGQCLDDQKKLLLDLRSEFKFNSSTSRALVKWNETGDCCKWRDVGCDDSGRVISLNLYDEGISGRFGESSDLFRLTYLSWLDLSDNDFTTSQIPNQFNRLTNLTYLDLSHSGFMGPIPSTLANLENLVQLDLSSNFLTGSVPSFHKCKNLENVDLSHNNLMGSLSHLHFQGLTNLSHLDLSHNSLNDTIPHHLLSLPSIVYLYLSNNQFNGQIKDISILDHSNLVWLDLSGNRIEGPIPNFFFQLPNMTSLRLSDNLFNGTFELNKIQSLTSLSELTLSNNNLSVDTTNMSSSSYLNLLHMSSCNLHDFPNLRNLSYFADLDLSNNHLHGDIPSWIWGTGMSSLNLSLNLLTDFQTPYHIPGSLQTLDLHSNLLSCEFPLLRPYANESDYDFANFLFLANNRLTGVVPTSICNIPRLKVLDLSFNNLNGSIPPCLLEESFYLKVLNLRGNNIVGVISDTIIGECALKTFDVSDNNLGGKIPKSLANCNYLAVMNVGHNNFDDSFPCMSLPESLKVLVLRSNRFHGELRCGKSWPDLQILDISSNNFSGALNLLNFSSLRGMMLQSQARRPTRSASDILSVNNLYRDEVTIILKNVEVNLVKIWPDFTSIDLSSNRFRGEIPYAIGNLTSLYLLNLSHNSLTDAIPKSLGALTELGSLDLSSNNLTGRIPDGLTKLDFLSFLNLSYNHLTGTIPTGRQFQTFSADSYVGNAGLSGLPLNGSFNNRRPPGPSPPEDSESKDEEIKWEYVFIALGYVVGIGSVAWTLLCCRSLRERYFEKIEEVADKIFYERGRRRRHERRVRRRREEKKRREERRNGLRRYHE